MAISKDFYATLRREYGITPRPPQVTPPRVRDAFKRTTQSAELVDIGVSIPTCTATEASSDMPAREITISVWVLDGLAYDAIFGVPFWEHLGASLWTWGSGIMHDRLPTRCDTVRNTTRGEWHWANTARTWSI